jgi:hypothetical protein
VAGIGVIALRLSLMGCESLLDAEKKEKARKRKPKHFASRVSGTKD